MVLRIRHRNMLTYFGTYFMFRCRFPDVREFIAEHHDIRVPLKPSPKARSAPVDISSQRKWPILLNMNGEQMAHPTQHEFCSSGIRGLVAGGRESESVESVLEIPVGHRDEIPSDLKVFLRRSKDKGETSSDEATIDKELREAMVIICVY